MGSPLRFHSNELLDANPAGGIPLTAIQALMEAQPGDEPVDSYEDILDKIDGVVAALDVLTDRERWVVEATIWRGLSMAQLGNELGLSKSTVHRIYHTALEKLATALGGTRP